MLVGVHPTIPWKLEIPNWIISCCVMHAVMKALTPSLKKASYSDSCVQRRFFHAPTKASHKVFRGPKAYKEFFQDCSNEHPPKSNDRWICGFIPCSSSIFFHRMKQLDPSKVDLGCIYIYIYIYIGPWCPPEKIHPHRHLDRVGEDWIGSSALLMWEVLLEWLLDFWLESMAKAASTLSLWQN